MIIFVYLYPNLKYMIERIERKQTGINNYFSIPMEWKERKAQEENIFY